MEVFILFKLQEFSTWFIREKNLFSGGGESRILQTINCVLPSSFVFHRQVFDWSPSLCGRRSKLSASFVSFYYALIESLKFLFKSRTMESVPERAEKFKCSRRLRRPNKIPIIHQLSCSLKRSPKLVSLRNFQSKSLSREAYPLQKLRWRYFFILIKFLLIDFSVLR